MTSTLYILASNEALARHRAVANDSSVYPAIADARADLDFLQSIEGSRCAVRLWTVEIERIATHDGTVTRVLSCRDAEQVTA